jgi:hypothetical protein
LVMFNIRHKLCVWVGGRVYAYDITIGTVKEPSTHV